MRKKMLFLCLFLCAVVICKAQSASSHIISPQGGYDKNDNYSLEWTLGETVATTSTTPAYIYTQGFNQSFIVRTEKKLGNEGNRLVNVIVAPNPVTANLTVAIGTITTGKYTVVITNLLGVHVYESQTNFHGKELIIAMNGYANGAYLLRVLDANKKVLNTTTIIKL
jgi:hypothetical protein